MSEETVQYYADRFEEVWTHLKPAVEELCKRTGLSRQEALLFVAGRQVEITTNVLHKALDTLAEAYNNNAAAIREQKDESQEVRDKQMELQERGIELMERALEDGDEPWKGW